MNAARICPSRRGESHGRRHAAVRLSLTLLVFVAAVVVLAAAPALAAAAVWVIPATARAFPSTQPSSSRMMSLDAAGNEYEGAQVVVRGGAARDVRLSWTSSSDTLIIENATLAQVAFVHITHASTDTHLPAGYYPDPLLPREFGAAIRMPAGTAALYVLVHVPLGAKDGAYSATLRIENGNEAVNVPVRLRVWDFGWSRLMTRSAFVLSRKSIQQSLRGSISLSGKNEDRILTAYYQMLRQHGVTPIPLGALPRVSGDGSVDAERYAAAMEPWVDSKELALPDVQLPWFRWFPWSLTPQLASERRLYTYLQSVCQVFAAKGWQKKALVYVIDEPTRTTTERQAEIYARLLHRASAAAGFRCRFLLTDDPRPTSLGGIKTANTFLFDDVDIWCTRYYYFFGRVPALRARRAAGQEIWWYVYANTAAAEIPGYLIEKPLADQRVFGWLMHQWDVDGLLNWGTNRWGDALTGNGWRDPYKDPLSYRKPLPDGRVANGDTCLIYPGYYPRYGLNDPFAGPASSLRLEALRDGFEDREYLRLASRTSAGAAFARNVAAQVAWFPYPIRQANVFKFPKYTSKSETFSRARRQLALRIEQARSMGQP